MATAYVIVGFDCDRPRGDFTFTKEGDKIANVKLASIQSLSSVLEKLAIPRTFFICGQFLESMCLKFGSGLVRDAFAPNSLLVELADHTYSHNIFKPISTRKDKSPIPALQIVSEYHTNTGLFQQIFNKELSRRGVRAPLGYFRGLQGHEDVAFALKKAGALYISSDLRDSRESINPPICLENNTPRQPYYYPCGLWEIPSHGWHDTIFSGVSKTPVYENYPKHYQDIVCYYRTLIKEAQQVAVANNRDFLLGLVMHPYDNRLYDPSCELFSEIMLKIQDLNAKFLNYRSAWELVSGNENQD